MIPFDKPPAIIIPKPPQLIRPGSPQFITPEEAGIIAFVRKRRASGGGNDANTVVLLHGDGADTSTTITNSAAGGSTAFTANGDAQIDTGQSKFGGASIQFDGTGDSVTFDGTGSDFTWAGDFTIDFQVRSTTAALAPEGGQQRLLSFGTGSTNLELIIDNSPAGVLVLETGAGSVIITGSTNISDSNWHHIEISRSGTDLRMFLDGTQEGSTATNSTTWVGSATATFGRYAGGGVGSVVGHLDEIRVSKGIARHTANFTPPTAAYS